MADAAEVELSPELRTMVDELHASLDRVDHYALLGVPRSADRRAIKSAFFQNATRLHPDRYFGKKLGPYKAKMEAIFVRMTLAHDTLAGNRRAEYDEYLNERDRTAAFERALTVSEDDLVVAEERPTDPDAVRQVGSGTRPRVEPPPAAATPSPEAERARREALARRLAGSSRRIPAVRPPSSPSNPVITTPAAGTRLPTPSPSAGNVSQPVLQSRAVDTLIAAARAAITAGDLATASTKMRLAARIDPTWAREADELAHRAYAGMTDAYVKQARYEEAQERWLEAALSWVKAAEGRPSDALLHERAANAFRRGGGDLHRAARFAEAAVRLRPDDARCRSTLAAVYLDAGLVRRAKAEIDTALRLAPQDREIRDLAADIARRI